MAEKIVKWLSGQGDRKASVATEEFYSRSRHATATAEAEEEEVEKEIRKKEKNSGSRSRQGTAEEDKRSRQRRALSSNYSNRGDRLLKRLSGGSKVVSAGARSVLAACLGAVYTKATLNEELAQKLERWPLGQTMEDSSIVVQLSMGTA